MASSSAFPGITTLLAFVLLCAGRSFAHDGHPAPIRAVPPADLHRATLTPDRIVLTWSGDPATTQAVTWRTSTEVTRGVAQLGLASDRAQTSASEFATTPVRHETQFGPVHYHTVEFHSLSPDTLYAYRVGDGVNWSEWFHFRTARSEPAPFTSQYVQLTPLRLKRTTYRYEPGAARTVRVALYPSSLPYCVLKTAGT